MRTFPHHLSVSECCTVTAVLQSNTLWIPSCKCSECSQREWSGGDRALIYSGERQEVVSVKVNSFKDYLLMQQLRALIFIIPQTSHGTKVETYRSRIPAFGCIDGMLLFLLLKCGFLSAFRWTCSSATACVGMCVCLKWIITFSYYPGYGMVLPSFAHCSSITRFPLARLLSLNK